MRSIHLIRIKDCKHSVKWAVLISTLCIMIAGFRDYTPTYTTKFKQELPNPISINQNVHEPHKSMHEPQTKQNILSKFRENFKLWDQMAPVLTDEPARNSAKYFIYECEEYCCGWADQMKGTMFAYIVANLTGRTFKARYLKPDCDPRDYLMPNKIDWYLDKNFKAPVNESSYINHIGDEKLKNTTSTTNFTEYFHIEKKYQFFISNLEYFSGLKNTTVYTHQLSWMKNLTPADTYAAVFKRLFKLPPRLMSKLNNLLDEALPTRNHRLICIHVRSGYAAFKGEAPRTYLYNLPKIWSWMKNQSQTDFDKIFVTSDSQKVIDSAYNQSFSERLISIPGDIIHSNKYDRMSNITMDAVCKGMEKLLLEVHMLMNCDVLVRGHSGLSVISSIVRGTDEGLYCLQDETGIIIPCHRNKFNPEFL